jgi:hypothetical protein
LSAELWEIGHDDTLSPYWIFAIIGFSERKMKILRRQVKGIGTINRPKTAISATRRAKTWGT